MKLHPQHVYALNAITYRVGPYTSQCNKNHPSPTGVTHTYPPNPETDVGAKMRPTGIIYVDRCHWKGSMIRRRFDESETPNLLRVKNTQLEI